MAGNARAATPPQYGEMESAMTCKDHEHHLTLCWRCQTDEIWNPTVTMACQECSGPPPENADQCEGHQGEPCWCGVAIDEPCDNGAHLAAEVQRNHDIAMGM